MAKAERVEVALDALNSAGVALKGTCSARAIHRRRPHPIAPLFVACLLTMSARGIPQWEYPSRERNMSYSKRLISANACRTSSKPGGADYDLTEDQVRDLPGQR